MPSPKPSDVAAVVELLKRDPELETWQLTNRGYPAHAIQAARRQTGIVHPTVTVRSLDSKRLRRSP